MNRFFQALVGRFLTDHLLGLTVHSEHGLKGMVAYGGGTHDGDKPRYPDRIS
jgi:hypothetical protein